MWQTESGVYFHFTSRQIGREKKTVKLNLNYNTHRVVHSRTHAHTRAQLNERVHTQSMEKPLKTNYKSIDFFSSILLCFSTQGTQKLSINWFSYATRPHMAVDCVHWSNGRRVFKNIEKSLRRKLMGKNVRITDCNCLFALWPGDHREPIQTTTYSVRWAVIAGLSAIGR